MKKSEYPIVVIDEQEDQLDELKKAFQLAGKQCFTIQYDAAYNEEQYTGIELLFLDMNLNPGPGKNDVAICATLENAIRTYIADDNGPYVLIFWTSRPDLVDVFKEYLRRFEESPVNTHRPIYVDTLSKEDFRVSPKETLESILSQPIVKLIFSLSSKLHEASSTAFKELIDCVPLTKEWGDNHGYLATFKEMFTKIAVTSVGKHNAASMPDRAIFEVVGREILHHLIKNSNDEWRCFLEIDDEKADRVKGLTNNNWQYSLNTVLHVESCQLGNFDRGAVLTGKKYIFDSLLDKDLYEWYKEEFQIKKDQDPDFRIVPVAIEISPACDYAQGNSRLLKYVLGVCRISKSRTSNNIESGSTPPFKKVSKHKTLPTFFLNSQYYKISLSYNYVIGLRTCIAEDLEHLFTLREEIVNHISNQVSDYSSRIGLMDVNES